MNRLRKVIGSTVISLLGQGVTWTSTLILTIAYGRYLGDIKYGELFFAITFVGLVGFPIDAGFNQQMVRDVAQEPSKALRYLTNILCFKFILWATLYGFILLLSYWLGYDPEVRTLIAICGLTLLTSSMTTLMSSANYAFERVIYSVIGNILEKGLDALVGAILLAHGASVETMAFVLLAGSTVSFLWQTFWILRLVGIPITFDVPLARMLIKTSIPFILNGALVVVYYRLDTVILSLISTDEVIGWYGAAYRLFDTLVFLPSLVINAIMSPVFAKLSVHSERELKFSIEKSLNFLLFCGIPITAGLIVAAPNIISFLYHGDDFANAAPALQFLAPGLLFLYVNSVFTSILICTGREKKITIMAAIALVFNLGFNLILIPLYQHIGAALMTSLTELLLMLNALVFLPRTLWPSGSVKVGLKASLAAIIMGVAVWFLRDYTLLIIIPVAGVVYFGVAMLIGTIPREDVKALYSSIRNKAGKGKAEDEGEAGEDEFPSFAEEEVQLGQGLQLVLAHEMTNPFLPAFKFDMTTTMLPALKREATNPLMPIYKRETQLLEAMKPLQVEEYKTQRLGPTASTTEEESEVTILRSGTGRRQFNNFPKSNDDDRTLLKWPKK